MRIAVVGGGPGGLYFSILMRKVAPDWEVTVFERNAPTDAFGFGVVFSDETLTVFEHADPETYWAITERFARWTDIDIHYRGSVTRSGGHGFSALGRRELLGDPAGAGVGARASRSGFRPRRRRCPSSGGPTWWWPPTAPRARCGRALAREFVPVAGPPRTAGTCGWAPTSCSTRSSSSSSRRPTGVFQAHAYPYDDRMSTFIVEMQRAGVARRRARLAGAGAAAAGGQRRREHRAVRASCSPMRWRATQLVANNSQVDRLRDGPQPLLAGRQRRPARRRRAHGALLDRLGDEAGDGGRGRAGVGAAVVTARTSSARSPPTRPSAGRSSRARSAPRRLRSSGLRGSGGTSSQERLQFAFNLLTRSRRVTYDNLRLRDPEFVAEVHPDPRPPMFMPFRLRDLELPNRVVVSPMDMYSAVDGTPSDFHLVHLGSRALGGAGAGDDRDDLRVGRGADHPGLRRHVYATSTSGRGGGSSTSCTRTAELRDRRAARALRPQGLDEADVGGDRRAARRTATGR